MRKRDAPWLRVAMAVAVAIVAAGPAWADTSFDDEKKFLARAGPTSFESFEELATDDAVSHASIRATGFSLTAERRDIGIFSYAVVGLHATDGSKHLVWDADPGEITFTFDAPVTAFGATLVDALDRGGDSRLSLTTDGGAAFPDFLRGPLSDANETFFGIVTDAPFTRLTIHNNTRDSMGFDGVHFGPVSEPGPVIEPGPIAEPDPSAEPAPTPP